RPITRHHADWLSLVEVSGPFLSLPVLARALPQGLDAVDPETVATLRRAHSEWQDEPALQGQWVRWVLGSLLDFGEGLLVEGPAVPTTLTHSVPEHGETLRPDLAVLDPGRDRVAARLLVAVWPDGQPLDARLAGARWAATPLDRMVDLLRGTGVRLGLVTNGERWTLVDAPRGQTSGFATWEAGIWLEERSTLNAFVTLVGAHRFFSVPETDTLEALLAESANAQQEVTDQLGRQVRAAVEMLVDAFSRADRERGGRLLGDLDPRTLYQGALTTMMRLVFLLAAEERGLFLLGDQLYDESYAVSTLRGQLQEEADRFGEEPLERRHAAWQRLLATFRMVHGGVQHEQLRLPAYGGGLFDPDRFPFLEGRKPGVATTDEPVPIDDRTVLHLLDALQVLRRKGRGAGPAEAQRLSYRALDVEQIGHVYEGLLDHTAVRVDDPAVGFDGKLEPEVSLRLVEEPAARGREALVDWLREETGESRAWVERRLDADLPPAERQRLLVACDNHQALAERVAPFGGLLRRDLRGAPLVYLPGSTYVTKASERRSSGTYYTPRALAEEVVRHTLDPLVHRPGPAEGAEPADWRLRPSSELLDLKVCDMAMGSGAFLVAACRYLADRLVEAWQAEAATDVSGPGGAEVPLPPDPEERAALARRLVADRCLFGVDKNPMAVEMAKLSMWLITLAKGRPFTFLNHALRGGDSLLG
ncbi:MAG TPA: restriction endonuclease, partial [Actinomycetes bacterium]|nr:restriction endonuclease [Actinomycetes bacterium]